MKILEISVKYHTDKIVRDNDKYFEKIVFPQSSN